MTPLPGSPDEARLLRLVDPMIFPARPQGAAPLPLGVAVSGGGDSVALLHLLHRAGQQCHAVTVDHGLRAESAAEARQVADFCARLGIAHSTLRWQGPAAQGNLMDQARRARLSLIADWAAGQGIGHVALGHTADDQAESFLMNLGRAAGLDGLSGMRRSWLAQGVHWHRPLLDQSRARLRAYLRGQGVSWIDDPSNDNDRFTRVKARRAVEALRPLGITVERLGETIAHLAKAQEVLVQATATAAAAMSEGAGALTLPMADWCALPTEIRRRLLIAAIRWMSGADYPPREPQIARLILALDQGQDATLGGVRFRCRNARLSFVREPRAVAATVAPGAIWDHRWRVEGPFQVGDTIAALTAEGLAQCPDWRASGPRDALLVSPAIWRAGQLIAAPLARPAPEWRVSLQPSFGMFILAH